MARKKKPPKPEPYFDESGQQRFIVVETFDGEKHRGFWVGEPHKSAFFGLPEKRDKRGVTGGLKQRVRAEAATRALLREAYKHPLPPIPRPSNPHANQASAPEWGTLEWYRNELAKTQDRLRLVESEREALLDEKRERDPVVQYLVEEPSKRASRPRNRPLTYAAEFQKWILGAAKRLAVSPHADDKELAKAIKEATHTEASARYLANWIPHNRIAIEEMAIKIREKMATRRDVGNGTRNPRRDVSR